MAITFIYPIKSTPANSIEYNKSNKEGTVIKEKDDSMDSLNYIMRDKRGNVSELSKEYLEKMKGYISIKDNKVTFETISTALNCSLNNANEQWNLIRQKYERNRKANIKENLQYCIVQNFGNDLDPLIANEIGVKFAKDYLSDYQCIVSTHINTGYVHNHIEFNATSFVTGKKFNDNLKAVSDIRKISDKLCEEYNLDILENTRDLNLIKYKDMEGNTKFFEPTERKNKILENEFSNKNDYRNTVQFKNFEKSNETHLETLRKDINKVIPFSNSYDEFIQQMINLGYEVKAKNKKGEWRKSISFKEATWDKFTRDKSLGEEYSRENLTKLILNNLEKNKNKTIAASVNKSEIEVIDDTYNNEMVRKLDVDYRYIKKKDGIEKIQRSGIEKYIIIDTKKLDKEINNMINNAYKIENKKQTLSTESKRKQYLLDRINGNLKTLKFVEDKSIKSFDQIQGIVSVLYEKRNKANNEINNIAAALKKANRNVILINKYNDLKEIISLNNENNNNEYNNFEKTNDLKLLESYENELKRLNLFSENNQVKYIDKYNKFNNSFKQLCIALENINKQIKDYDECVFNIKYVDKNNENKYEQEINKYYSVRSKNKDKDKDKSDKDFDKSK